MENRKRNWRLRFSLRTFLFIIAFMAAYLASWMATSEYGIVPGTAQYSPLPFVIVESGVPQFSNLGPRTEPFVMQQRRTYYCWFFGNQHRIGERNLERQWTERSTKERREIMKDIGRSYGRSKKRTATIRKSP